MAGWNGPKVIAALDNSSNRRIAGAVFDRTLDQLARRTLSPAVCDCLVVSEVEQNYGDNARQQ